jgi:hypothetical protein
MTGTKHQSTLLLGLPYMALLLLGFGLLGGLLVQAGLAGYLGLTGPQRLAYRVVFQLPKPVARVIEPQPAQVQAGQTNVIVVVPPAEAFIANNIVDAPVWGNGRAFKSGALAGWEVASSAWRLWLMGVGALIGLRFITR